MQGWHPMFPPVSSAVYVKDMTGALEASWRLHCPTGTKTAHLIWLLKTQGSYSIT